MSGYRQYLDHYPRTGQRWLPAEDRGLLHEVEWTKDTMEQIARHHRRTPGAIAARVMLLRDQRIEEDMRNPGLTRWGTFGWMGKYPRKGADWSPEEDKALLRAYESGRYLNKEIAATHLREPVAVERRLDLLRKRRRILEQYKQMRSWASEREAAQRAVSKIKEAYASAMWPGVRDNTFDKAARQRGIKPGVLFGGLSPAIVIACPHGIDLVALSDLPPEVAQALQFGQGEEA